MRWTARFRAGTDDEDIDLTLYDGSRLSKDRANGEIKAGEA